MGVADSLGKNVQAWGVLAIVVVIISIILTRFKTSNAGGITCPAATSNATHLYYNSTSNLCCTGTALTTSSGCGTGMTSSIGGIAGTLDTFVTALAEPKNWVAIVIIAVIGFSMLRLFSKKN